MKLPNMAAMQVKSAATAAADDTKAKWQMVETTLKEIFDKRPITGSFQVLHKTCFGLATSQPQFEYDQLKRYITQQVTAQREAVLVAVRSGASALPRITAEYEQHAFAVHKYSHLFLHLDRHWCPQQRLAGVVALGRDVFGRVMLMDPQFPSAIASAVSENFLAAIERERNGEDTVAHSLLRSVCVMLQEVGHTSTLKHLVIDPFMAQSMTFFEAEASRLLSALPAPEYLAAYRQRVEHETTRCNSVFPNYRYTSLVLSAMSNTYVAQRKEQILEQAGPGGMQSLAANWRLREIGIVFRALSDIGCGSDVVDVVCKHLLAEYGKIAQAPTVSGGGGGGGATAAPAAAAASSSSTVAASGATKPPAAGAGAGASAAKPPQITPAQAAQAVMTRCMQLLAQAKELITQAFVLDSGRPDRVAETAVNKTVDVLLNADDIISEQLATHHDAVLRAQVTEEELEKACENVVTIFSRLKNKDVFEVTMKTFLGRRMLSFGTKTSGQTEEEHKERILINMLKREVGTSATTHFEGMFNDKRTSEDISATFHNKLESRGERMPVDIDVVVVTDGLWPQLPALTVDNLPLEMKRPMQLYTSFYLGMHKGRRLNFLYSQGTADVRMLLPTGKKHELNLPTFCLPVLLLFQGDEALTVQKIADACGMAPADVARAVFSLARATQLNTGVLVTDTQGVGPNSVVKFNALFKSRTNKIKIAAAVARPGGGGGGADGGGGAGSDAGSGGKTTSQIVNEDRKFRIDATVVRIMKSRRVMQHKPLVNEVITMLKSGFAATADQVKQRIENLIDREFLVRDDDGSSYVYKA